MKNALVTGAAGFVGGFLLDELRRHGIPTIGVSRASKDHLIQIPTYGREMNWGPLLGGIDTVIHLAARVHVMNDQATDPLSEFRKANVEPTLHLAREAAIAGVRRFIFVSTIKVNGETTKPGQPFTAADPPAPQGPYAISKAEAEAGLFDLGHRTGLEIVVIRPPLVYGPGVKGNMATLTRLAKLGVPSPFPSINNKRSLVHVKNLCALIRICITHPQLQNEVFLVSDGKDVSTNEIYLRLLRTHRGTTAEIPVPVWAFRLPMLIPTWRRVYEKMFENLQVDIEKTINQLAYTPSAPADLRDFD
jgi:UDP-4-keto-D-QuiNAc 4-reductase